jgi:hypothetical protein
MVPASPGVTLGSLVLLEPKQSPLEWRRESRHVETRGARQPDPEADRVVKIAALRLRVLAAGRLLGQHDDGVSLVRLTATSTRSEERSRPELDAEGAPQLEPCVPLTHPVQRQAATRRTGVDEPSLLELAGREDIGRELAEPVA